MSDADLRAWAALSETSRLGPARYQRIARALNDEQSGASSLLGTSVDKLISMGLSAALAERAVEMLVDPIGPPEPPKGSQLLHPDHERYPRKRLLEGSPPLTALLYAVGDTSLLDMPSVAIVGSRHAGPNQLKAAGQIARAVVGRGYVVVSGLAKGVDEAGHAGALGAGGATIAVLAEGILRSERARELMTEPSGDVLVLSEFQLTDNWAPGRAMQRNGTVAALSDAVIVVASDTRGGTWEMGKLCLRSDKKLGVVAFPPHLFPGNEHLISDGGISLDPENLQPGIADLLSESAPSQQNLF